MQSSFRNKDRQAGPSRTPISYVVQDGAIDLQAYLGYTQPVDDDDVDASPPLTHKLRYKRPFGMSADIVQDVLDLAQDRRHPMALDNPPPAPIPTYRPPTTDDTLALLLPLLILLSTLLFLMLLFIILIIVVRKRARIALSDSDGPLDVGREEALEGAGGLDGIEARWLETQEDVIRRGYRRAKDWVLSYPPGTQPTDITLSQFLTIQEKGVSAWSFDPDYESNPSVYVEARTEITFLADGEGMAPQEGGGVCVQSNLPLPKMNEVYYWEVKMFNKPDNTNVAIGLTTKPYPQFRLPGWSKYSIGYFSSDGFKCHNYPFAAQSYGPAYVQGDVIGIGYRPRTGTVFFTRNGKRLEDAFVGLNRYNLFPTVGADGACEVHVNLGQAGFVFIEANVKKWGLAPMVGTLAPPPAYGQERGTILMESGQGSSTDPRVTRTQGTRDNEPPPPPISPYDERSPSSSNGNPGARFLAPAPRSSSLRNLASANGVHMDNDEASEGSPPNPPTPHRLDISLHSLSDSAGRNSAEDSYFPSSPAAPSSSTNASSALGVTTGTHSPPSYAIAVSHGSLGGTSASGHKARRGSGRTHQLANAVFGMLSDRGLLTPLSHSNPSPQPSPGLGDPNAHTSGQAEDLTEAEYERMLRANTARNSRPLSTNTVSTAAAATSADYSLQGWARWLGLRTAGSSRREPTSNSSAA